MLKDMVRDLEQIHEQKHSNATQQCGNGNSSTSSNSNSNTSNSNGNSSSNTNNNSSKSTNGAAKSSGNGSSSSSNTSAENGNSAPSKSAASSGTSATASSGSGVQASKIGATASPAKAMLNQATNTPSKMVPKGNPSTGVTSQQPTGKMVTKVTSVTPKPGNGTGTASGPSATTPGKVSSKSTSTHPSTVPAATGAGSSPTAAAAAAGNATPSTSTSNAAAGQHLIQSKEEHKKTCHRGANGGEKGDGSCVCYYCTLFGQSVCLECNHNQRTNETRDRLRKKIKQLQSNKDNQQLKSLNLKNIKIPHGGLLKKINTNKSNSTNAVTNSSNNNNSSSNNNSSTSSSTTSSNNATHPTSASKESSSGSLASKMEALKISNNKTTTATAGLATATKAPVVTKPPANKMNIAAAPAKPPEMAISAREVPQVPQPVVQPTLRPSVNNTPFTKVPPKPVEETLDALVRYIEGDYDDDKQKDNKKTAKKVKQKSKKQELKKITELGELKQKFSELKEEDKRAQNRLQFQQNLK
ncbi:AAEL002169-PA, partial [Aedes aegypti]